MSQTRVDWGSIAGLVRTLEIRRGPFWEPSRTRGAMEPADVLAIGDELECLLERLAVGRRKSVVLLGVMLILCLGLFAGLALVATRLSDWVATVGSLAVGVAIVVLALVYWRDWLIALYGAYTLPPVPPAPKPDELVAAMRRLCDGFAVLSDEAATVTLRKMKSCAPLAFETCMHTTVVGTGIQRRVRAA